MRGHVASPEPGVALGCARVPAGSLEGESRPDPRRRHRSLRRCGLSLAHDLRALRRRTTRREANLQTALSGAETYYAANDHSYVGIDGGPELPAGVSSISEIEIGLTFIPGNQSSPAPNVVSIYAHGPSVVVVTAYAKGPDLLRHSEGGP